MCILESLIDIEEVDVNTFSYSGFHMGIFEIIGPLPMKKIMGNSLFYEEMNNTGFQLNVDTLNVCISRYSSFPIEVLYLKNFSASEIQLNGTLIRKFVDDMEIAHKENKLKLVLSLRYLDYFVKIILLQRD